MSRNTSRKGPAWRGQRSCGPQCNVNTVQASKCRRGNRPAIITGKVAAFSQAERMVAEGPTGVVVVARMEMELNGTREACRKGRSGLASTTSTPVPVRVTSALRQVADGGVVPAKLGNASGGKAP
jgi:hypothetical protein